MSSFLHNRPPVCNCPLNSRRPALSVIMPEEIVPRNRSFSFPAALQNIVLPDSVHPACCRRKSSRQLLSLSPSLFHYIGGISTNIDFRKHIGPLLMAKLDHSSIFYCSCPHEELPESTIVIKSLCFRHRLDHEHFFDRLAPIQQQAISSKWRPHAPNRTV